MTQSTAQFKQLLLGKIIGYIATMEPALISDHLACLQKSWRELISALANQARRGRAPVEPAMVILKDYLRQTGKFVRPALFLFGYSLTRRQKPPQAVVRLALSLELIHNYLLIQDDIMDQGDTRRGRPSLHRAFKIYHAKERLLGESQRYGESLAMLMSDVVFSWAERLWAEAIATDLISPASWRDLDALKQEVYFGQYLDLTVAASQSFPSMKTLIQIMEYKTGRYSIFRPLQLGALAGGGAAAPDWWLPAAVALGIAYQIVDDILGTFGDDNITGKSAASDIAERKRTVLVRFAHQSATDSDKQTLRRYYLDHDPIMPLETIRDIFRRTAAESQARELADGYARQADALIAAAPIDNKSKNRLHEFSSFVIERAK